MSLQHRVLVIGVGSIGERHLRCFLATKRVTACFVEINDPLRKTIAERYPAAQPFSSLEDALQTKPDLAVVATPAQFHISLATQLATKGIHLLIEKPLSTSLEGIEQLQAAIHANNVRAGLAYVYRSHPVLKVMREALHSGRFGKPKELVCVSGQNFPFYRPAYRAIYYNNRATGGGAIQDALTHLVNAGEWLLGPIQRLVVDAAHQVLEGVDVEDTVHLLARHGEVLASYNLNQYQAPNESTITVVCESGTVQFLIHENAWRWQTEPGQPWQTEQLPPMERDTLFILQAAQFLDVIEGKAEILCPLAEGLQTLKVNLAALSSWDNQRWEMIP